MNKKQREETEAEHIAHRAGRPGGLKRWERQTDYRHETVASCLSAMDAVSVITNSVLELNVTPVVGMQYSRRRRGLAGLETRVKASNTFSSRSAWMSTSIRWAAAKSSSKIPNR